jgi:hypothetical protein
LLRNDAVNPPVSVGNDVFYGSAPRLHNEVRIVQWREWIDILYIINDRPVLSSERAPHINKPATVRQKKKIWSHIPNECLTPRQTGRLTVGHNITLTLSVEGVQCSAVSSIGGAVWSEDASVQSVICGLL